MPHPLEELYDLSASEILDAINERFRLKVAVAGGVAEVQCEKILKSLVDSGTLARCQSHDQDGYPDFTIWTPGEERGMLIEVKNVRNSKEGYKKKGQIVAYKAETQKTRTSNADESSRLYDANHFQILAVCLGAKTGDYTDFFFILSENLPRDKTYPHKLTSMQRVPLPQSVLAEPPIDYDVRPWYADLGELIEEIRRA